MFQNLEKLCTQLDLQQCRSDVYSTCTVVRIGTADVSGRRRAPPLPSEMAYVASDSEHTLAFFSCSYTTCLTETTDRGGPDSRSFVFLLRVQRAGAYGPGDAGVLDDAEAPAAAGGARRASSRATYKFPADRTSEDESSLVVEEDRRWWLEERTATGSRLPDCAHACGPCSPCRRVIVSFRCALMASESCPIAYRCMCRGRFFRVPSP